MTRVAPQSGVEHAAAVLRISAEGGELRIADNFKAHASQPQRHTEGIDEAECNLAMQRRQQRQRDHPGERALQAEDDIQALEGKTRIVIAPDLLVAPILAMPVVSPADVERE